MVTYFEVFYLFIYNNNIKKLPLLYIPHSLPNIEASVPHFSLSLKTHKNRVSDINIFFSDGFSGGLRRGLLPQPLPSHTSFPRPPPKLRVLSLPPPRTLRLPRNWSRMAGPPHLRRNRRNRRRLQASLRVGATHPGYPSRRQVRRVRRKLLRLRRLSVRVLRGGGDSLHAELQTHFPPRLRGPLDRSRSENMPSM